MVQHVILPMCHFVDHSAMSHFDYVAFCQKYILTVKFWISYGHSLLQIILCPHIILQPHIIKHTHFTPSLLIRPLGLSPL